MNLINLSQKVTLTEIAALEQSAFTKMELREFGYETRTTFFSDFTIADFFGLDAIRDTYKRSLESYKNDIYYMTELCMVLNHKCWQHYEGNKMELSQLYSTLYHNCYDYICNHYNGEDFNYFFSIID